MLQLHYTWHPYIGSLPNSADESKLLVHFISLMSQTPKGRQQNQAVPRLCTQLAFVGEQSKLIVSNTYLSESPVCCS